MKKIVKIILVILIVILAIIGGWLLSSTFAGMIGKMQNRELADVEVTNPTITYIGDSLTNGYYSDGGLHGDEFGYRSVVDNALGATSYNFAVGGYTSEDVTEQFENNTTLNEVNDIIYTNGYFHEGESRDAYLPVEQDVSIEDAIAQSDYVIATIGANDVITKLLDFNEDGSFSVHKDGMVKILKSIQESKKAVYSRIHEINPDVQIIDIGIYMAYPYLGEMFVRGLYPVLMFAESYLFFNDKELNVHKVTIRDNMQADIKGVIDNPRDIHPNSEGYAIMANQVLKEIAKLQ